MSALLPCLLQALEVIKKLKEVMPIDRAKMKLSVTTDPEGDAGVVFFLSEPLKG